MKNRRSPLFWRQLNRLKV